MQWDLWQGQLNHLPDQGKRKKMNMFLQTIFNENQPENQSNIP